MLLPVSMVPVKGPVPLRSLIADEDSLKLLADLQLNNSESIVLHNGVCVKQIADREPAASRATSSGSAQASFSWA